MFLLKERGIHLYKKYEALLEKAGVTSYKVAKDTGISPMILSDWKNGKSQPKVDKLMILAAYFGVDIKYFLE